MTMVKNIRITKKLWVSALTLMLIAPSCNLEIEETDSFQTAESVQFDGVENPAASLDGIYNDISGQTGDQGGLYALTEVTTDELVVPTRGTDWGDNGVWRTLHAHTWGPTHQYVVGVWNDKNAGVLKSTEVIHPLSNSTAEQVAHAKFTRAYNMWLVMDLYGQVPFREATDGLDVIPSVMTRAEAYDFVVTDLTEAIAGLPVANPTATDKFRATKAHARFLLAKVKLNARIYKGLADDADADMQSVIDLVNLLEADGYALTGPGTYFSNFIGPAYPETDIIWAVPAGAGNRMWNGLHYHQALPPDNPGGGWNGFTTLAEFYDKFEDNGAGDPNPIGGPQEERRGYVHSLTSTNASNFGFGYGFQIGQMHWWNGTAAVELKDRAGAPLIFTKTLPGLIGNNEKTGIRVLKYSPANGAYTSGVVMARFADAHLMKAEAMYRMGNTAGALTEINELRAMRSNTPALAGSLTEAMILDERARELYTEGWRRNDMVRFGVFRNSWELKEGENSADGHTDLFPIPASALLTNPGLVQNPGY
jgi:starch-binding outer membrane protein, SusD/RagB family